jgi:hypothetical protein
MSIAELVSAHLALPGSSWSIGGFGAIAEFHHVRALPSTITATAAVSPLGGIAIHARPDAVAIAYEVPAGAADYWHHGVVLCLPEQAARITTPGRVQDLGVDDAALQPAERTHRLFDLGIGAPTFRFCVRTADMHVIAALGEAAGTSFFDRAATLTPLLLEASPTRVAISALGRVEVYQPIALPGGKTPEGPHTHLIPGLLRSTHTHSRNVPVPEGLLPAATLYPEHPIVDGEGRRKPFDGDAHAAFQALLERYGNRQALATKREVIEAARTGRTPVADAMDRSRHGRLAGRVAVRQLLHLDGPAPALADWRAAYEAVGLR